MPAGSTAVAAVHPTNYNAAEGKFNDISSNGYIPFNFGSETVFEQKVDMSLAGAIMDCGECHVGGGGMQYIPNPMDGSVPRVRLDEIYTVSATATDLTSGKTYGEFGLPLDNTQYTGFNYFVDNYNVDGDTSKLEVQHIDFRHTGVMEYDCFICHFVGYDYDKRVETLREARIGALPAVGANLADVVPVAWDGVNNTSTPGYGTTVDYAKGVTSGDLIAVDVSGSMQLQLSNQFFNKFSHVPQSQNCANCHFGQEYLKDGTTPTLRAQVDWKKRGDRWEQDTTWDVHTQIGCVECHSRSVDPANAAQQAKLKHDPAKGDVPYSSLFNGSDNTMRTCKGCHLDGHPDKYASAPDYTIAHEQAGLNEVLLSSGNNGTADITHIDVMACEACHVRKLRHLEGGAMVDATGPDHFGRLADHENAYVQRDMYDNLNLSWYKGKLIKSSALLTMFFRDKNDVSFDVNNDGRGGGMDPILQTHVLATAASGLPLTEEAHGDLTAATFTSRINDINSSIQSLLGVSGKTPATKISFMGVEFQVNHNVSPAGQAWGAQGCVECHNDNAGFYNGPYRLIGDQASFYFDNAQNTPFTKVNGKADATNFHPNLKTKKNNRSIAVNIVTNSDDLTKGEKMIRTPDKSEWIWETTFKTRDMTWKDSIVGGAMSFPGATSTTTNQKGWMLKVEVYDNDPTRTATYGTVVKTFNHFNFNSSADATAPFTVTDLIASPKFTKPTDMTTYYTMTEAASGLTLTAQNNYQIRIHPQSDVGPFKMYGELWIDEPYVGTNGQSYTGRDAYVAYLNSLGAAPVADIALVDGAAPAGTISVDLDAVVTLDADTSAASNDTYAWTSSFGATATGSSAALTFDQVGTHSVTLTVTNKSGQIVATDEQVFEVSAPAPPAAAVAQTTYTNTGWSIAADYAIGATYNQLQVVWGDGQTSWINSSAATATLNHTYGFNFSAYDFGLGAFVYDVTVRAYNNGVFAGESTDTVQVKPW